MKSEERKIMITLVYGFFLGKDGTLSYSRLDTTIRVLLRKMGMPNPVFSDDDLKFIEKELVPINIKFNKMMVKMFDETHSSPSVVAKQ